MWRNFSFERYICICEWSNFQKTENIIFLNVVNRSFSNFLSHFPAWSPINFAQGNLHLIFNPVFPNALCLYSLKTSENITVFWCFHGVDKGCIANTWVSMHLRHHHKQSNTRMVWKPCCLSPLPEKQLKES